MKKLLLTIFLVIVPVLNIFAQTFNPIVNYNILAISLAVQGETGQRVILPKNGFVHGEIELGIYKTSCYYTTITLDNAWMSGIQIWKSYDHSLFEDDSIFSLSLKCTHETTSETKEFADVIINQSKNTGKWFCSLSSTFDDGKQALLIFEIELKLKK